MKNSPSESFNYFSTLTSRVFCQLSKIKVCVKFRGLAAVSFFQTVSLQVQPRLTKRAPDAGDSAQISGSFLRLIIFPAGRLRRPRPGCRACRDTAQVTQTVGTPLAKVNHFENEKLSLAKSTA